jgi:hypothetical protein
VKAFWDDKCHDEVAPWGDFTTILENTNGAVKPLIWPNIASFGNGTIKGISYFDAFTENTANCKSILFELLDPNGAGNYIFMTPGQNYSICEPYADSIVSYLGVIDLENDKEGGHSI